MLILQIVRIKADRKVLKIMSDSVMLMKESNMIQILQMKDALKEEVDILMPMRIEKIRNLVINNVGNIEYDIKKVLKKLTIGQTKGVITISYLRSSYIVNSHEFCFAYYEEEPFVHEKPNRIYFNMQSLFIGIEEDYQKLDESLHQKFIRVFDAMKETIHRWYIEQIYLHLENIMKMIVNAMQEETGINVFYGGYMEHLILLGKI